MPFDAPAPHQPRPEREPCHCLLTFGQSIIINGVCLLCGAWTGSHFGIDKAKLKTVIVELGMEGLMTPAEVNRLLDYYGLRNA